MCDGYFWMMVLFAGGVLALAGYFWWKLYCAVSEFHDAIVELHDENERLRSRLGE